MVEAEYRSFTRFRDWPELLFMYDADRLKSL